MSHVFGREQYTHTVPYCIIFSAIEVGEVIFIHLCVSMSVCRHKIPKGYELISMKLFWPYRIFAKEGIWKVFCRVLVVV